MSEGSIRQNRRGRFGKPGPYRGIGSEIFRGVCWLFLKATGWHVASDWPGVRKSVVVAAPHTSNLDGLVMLAIAGWYREKLSWMGKASLARGPLGGIMRRAGCVPVDRTKSSDVVSQMKDAFGAAEHLHLAVSPEGTREATRDWKSGFWHIARSADVPLLIAVLDYGAHEMRFEGPMQAGDSFEDDMAVILSHYRDVKGRYPERFCLPREA